MSESSGLPDVAASFGNTGCTEDRSSISCIMGEWWGVDMGFHMELILMKGPRRVGWELNTTVEGNRVYFAEYMMGGTWAWEITGCPALSRVFILTQ